MGVCRAGGMQELFWVRINGIDEVLVKRVEKSNLIC